MQSINTGAYRLQLIKDFPSTPSSSSSSDWVGHVYLGPAAARNAGED